MVELGILLYVIIFGTLFVLAVGVFGLFMGLMAAILSVVTALFATGIAAVIGTSVELASLEGQEWLDQLWIEMVYWFENDFTNAFNDLGKEIDNISDQAINGKEERLAKWRAEKLAEAEAEAAAANNKPADFNPSNISSGGDTKI